MNVGGGEAADQLVRMMLSFGEVSIRLGGSALKNMLALSLALAKNNKTISGKINLGKMLRQTRDLRQFPMSPKQYRKFSKLAKKQKILFSAIRDKDDRGKIIDVILPVTELDRANMIFERAGFFSRESAAPQREQRPLHKEREAPRRRREERNMTVDLPEREDPQPLEDPMWGQENSRGEAAPSKKDSPSQRASPDTRSSSSSHKKASPSERTSDRPSVEERLKSFRAELDQWRKSAPVRGKDKTRPKSR